MSEEVKKDEAFERMAAIREQLLKAEQEAREKKERLKEKAKKLLTDQEKKLTRGLSRKDRKQLKEDVGYDIYQTDSKAVVSAMDWVLDNLFGQEVVDAWPEAKCNAVFSYIMDLTYGDEEEEKNF